ncbi:MAG: TrmH family RNA methyltransferase [Candidatus Omnitrophica bacterium]|nr:TrmH family RNA methyltransferase [Candidatus Omnitrophota bacterium]MDD5429332.1 TrmH family RNA methyltransferase [Candidatus Omnitrophota bacterium]
MLKDKQKILDNINIVLAEPKIPENIGLAARVLKNTSFPNLSLVRPCLNQKASEVARRAKDILEEAKVYNSLSEALSSSQFVFGASSRKHRGMNIHNFNDIKYLIISLAKAGRISIVFGKESFGLCSHQIKECTGVFYIPANPEFSSYNLSQAVGIVCYEIATVIDKLYTVSTFKPASRGEYETFFDYLKDYLSLKVKKDRVKTSLSSLKRLFLRTSLSKNEISLLKDIFKNP